MSRLTVKIVLFLLSCVAIVYFMPRADENFYTYEISRPWSYPLLTAPFDIPIHLDSVSARTMKDSIDKAFEPVYKRDREREHAMTEEFAKSTEKATGLTGNGRNRIISELNKVYSRGIVDQETYEKMRSGAIPTVRFVIDNVAVATPTTEFISPRRAYTMVDSALRGTPWHDAVNAAKLSEALQPNIKYDSTENRRMIDELYQKAMAPVGVVQQGERIIDQGDIVTPRVYTILRTFEEISRERNSKNATEHVYTIAGQLLYVVIVFTALYIFLYYFRPVYFNDTKKLCFIVVLITGFSLFGFAMAATFTSGLYIAPLTILPVMLIIFLDSRTALFAHTAMILICGLVATFPLEFIFVQYVAGVTAIASIKELSKRSQLVRAAVTVFIAYAVSYVAVEMIHTGALDKLSTRMFGCFAVNAILISFAYFMVFIFEKVFGFTSRVTLVELSDINNKVLSELSEECPGTFQHSMAVSNLATVAAARIGANVQLVRAGALYHDIGKLSNPAFFTENQHGVNPHDALDPLQSARIVISHVTDGLRRAEKAKLPDVIKEFITEHHGAGKAKYFYNTYCNAHPDETVDEAPFTYPGPNPQSRETSILMMADAVEAASRSLTDHSAESISALVNRIIDSQIADGLHNDSPISFRDVKAIKDSFISRLRTMYHSRVSYPERKQNSVQTSDKQEEK